jgi:hypothetical protein
MKKIVNWIVNPVLPDSVCAALNGSSSCRICWGCVAILVGTVVIAVFLSFVV